MNERDTQPAGVLADAPGPGQPPPADAPPRAARPRRLARTVLVALVLLAAAAFAAWRGYGWYHWRAAETALARDHCREALGHCEATLRVWPDDSAVLFRAARATRRAGAFPAAEQYLDRCPPRDDDVVLERALLRAARGETDEVAAFCLALADRDHPATPLVLEALTQGYTGQLRWPEATRCVERWLAREPDRPQAVYLHARLQLQASNQDEAVRLLRRVTELDADRDDARLLLAGSLLDVGQAQEALPHLEILRRRLPDNPVVPVHLARCLDLLGRQDEAVVLLDDALGRLPDYALALLERGKLALRAGELEAAGGFLRRACDRDPGSHEAHYQLLQCLKRQGKSADARAVMDRMGHIEKDIARLRDIGAGELSRRPNDPALHAELGEIYLRLGAERDAVRWLESAVRLDPRQAAAHRGLARYHQMLGQFGTADRHRALAEAGGAAKQ
jgi:predicted Zn-dependent protease